MRQSTVTDSASTVSLKAEDRWIFVPHAWTASPAGRYLLCKTVTSAPESTIAGISPSPKLTVTLQEAGMLSVIPTCFLSESTKHLATRSSAEGISNKADISNDSALTH